MKKQNAKKLKGQGPLLKSLVNRNIGSRTGRDVKAGKKITKDKDGYENFDDYWSESDADLTSNTTFHSVSSRISANQEKENVSSLVTSSQPVGSKVSQLTSNFSSASCSQPVGAAACYLGYLTVGSRTGQNVIAGKNIRKHDDGFDNFDTYWSESEPDSMLSFHKSVHINESKSFISAGIPREEEEDQENDKSEMGGDSDSEVIINTRRSAGMRDTVNISQIQTAGSESRDSHYDLSGGEDQSSVGNISITGVEDPDSVCESLDEEELGLEEEQRETEDGGETEDRSETEDAAETEKMTERREQHETATSQSVCSEETSLGEEETGTVMRRPGSIGIFKHEQRQQEILQECSAEGVTETINKKKAEHVNETKNSTDISNNSYFEERKSTMRQPQRKSKGSENTTDNESVEIPARRTRSRSRGSVGNVSIQSKGQNVKDTHMQSEEQSLQNTSLLRNRQSNSSVQDNSNTSIHKRISGKRSSRKSNKSVLDKEDDLNLSSAREMNASLNKSKGGKKGQSGQKLANSRMSVNSDVEDMSKSSAVQSGKKQTKVSQRKYSEVKDSINSHVENDSETSDVATKSDKKGTKLSQRKSSESRKSRNSDVESDFDCKGEHRSLKLPTRVSPGKSSESKKSVTSNADTVSKDCAVETKSVVKQTKVSLTKSSVSKSFNSDVEDTPVTEALETKSLQKQAIVRQRKSSESKSVHSEFEDAETKSVQKQSKSRNNGRKSSKVVDDEADTSAQISATNEAVDSGNMFEVEEDITNIQKTHGPLKAVKSNRKSLKTHQDQKQQAVGRKSTAHDTLRQDCDQDELTSSSNSERSESPGEDVGDEVIENGQSFSNTIVYSSDHGQKEKSVEVNEPVTAKSKASVKSDIREITPSDLIISAPVGNTTARSRLNLGGDVTGSISKNTDATTKTVSNTPMHSFRTKKRLSYSKFLDDSVEQEKASNTSEEKNSSRPPALESLVEEQEQEEEEEGNCDFLSLRTSHRDTLHKTTDGDSIDDSFWKVEEEKPKKGKTAKRASNMKGKGKGGNLKERSAGNDNGESGKEEGSGEEKEGERKKSAGEKRGRKKGQKKSADEGSPEKQSRKSSEEKTDVQEDIQSKASVKQRRRAKSSGITRTPSSTKLKRSSTDTMNTTRAGGKRSRSARVTKTKEMMQQEKRSPQSPVDNLPVARGRLSHLHLAGVGETPRSGVSFRQRRRRSLSDSGKPLLNTSCPVDLSFSPAVGDDEARSPDASRRVSMTPDGPLSSVLPLTPCLVPQGTVKSVEKKKRRVTISNIVEKASVSYTDSSVSDPGHSKASPGNCSANVSSTSYGDITGSPVHFFEVTNTETPDPITAPPKTKIIYPKPGPDGLRRSQRVRVRPVEWYKNEHVIYENRAGDFVIAGIHPSKEAEYLAAELEKRKRRALSKLKQPKKPRISRQKLLERQNLSMHQDPPPELDYTISSEMPVINPNTNQEVLIDCVAPSDDAMYVGADGTSPREDDPYIICHALQQPRFTGGHLLIAPFKEKSRQLLTENTLIFTIIHGKLSVTIHRGSSILEAGDQFFVPRGNSYSIKNLRNEEAKLSFVNLLEGENQRQEENQE